MHYFIDGYNLLFRILHKDKDLQSQREHLIQDLHTKIRELRLDVTLVFDSFYQKGESERSHFKELEVIYTAEGESADDYIIQALKNSSHPQEETVVTSDNPLSRRAKLCYAKTVRVDKFLEELNKRYQNLKKRRKEQLPPQPLPKPKLPKKKEEPSTPSLSAEECFQYYLEVFQKEWEEEVAKEPEKPPSPRKKKRKKIKTEPQPLQDRETEMERWLKLFTKQHDEQDIHDIQDLHD